MFESDVELKLADYPEQVAAIVRETIQKIYPHYYPSGAVLFFLDLHSEVKIKERMFYEEIYLAMVRGNIIGTGSIRKNEICRLFILPEYQGKGYGSRLMDLLEARIFENYPKVHVDASFPAESMYLKRGYQIVSYEKMETENGDFLFYHTMEKENRQVYQGVVVRGYHCPPVQQPYWNTIYLEDFPDEELLNMIDHAYDTVLHKLSGT